MHQLSRFRCNVKEPGPRLPEKSSDCVATSRNGIHLTEDTPILDRLNSFLVSCPLPGLQTDQSRERFVDELLKSLAQHSGICNLSAHEIDGCSDPGRADFDAVCGILETYQKGERNEAIWLAFISVHFGFEPESIRQVYGKFGEGRWDWKSLAGNPDEVRNYLQANRERLKLLKFGNHRKFECKDVNKKAGPSDVICSFLNWVSRAGAVGPDDAFRSQISQAKNEEEAFDRLYKGLQVLRFGRTAKFDLLSLLGNLKILPVQPGHCYLHGSTGPQSGALLMVTGRKEGRLSRDVETVIMSLQKHLGISAAVLEDALCNWQK
jgi:Alpha-glutamyl/putrescinyl thymine pyrophosphorylase clade 3